MADEKKSINSDGTKAFSEFLKRHSEQKIYQEKLNDQEREFDKYREAMRVDQLEREQNFQREIAAREESFAQRERALVKRQDKFTAMLAEREVKISDLQANLSFQSVEQEKKIQQAKLELQQEKEQYNKENRERLERTSKSYVEDAIKSLLTQETKFSKNGVRLAPEH